MNVVGLRRSVASKLRCTKAFVFLFTFALRPTEWPRSNSREETTLFSIFKKNMMHKLFARLVMKIKPKERKTEKVQEKRSAPKSHPPSIVGTRAFGHKAWVKTGRLTVDISMGKSMSVCPVYA